MGVATRVKRAKGGGLALVSWSPDGQRVFAASVSAVFRVWETKSWTCEKWTHPSGRCKVRGGGGGGVEVWPGIFYMTLASTLHFLAVSPVETCFHKALINLYGVFISGIEP